MTNLEHRLRLVDPRLRTALLHHARGEHKLAREFLTRFLDDTPLDCNFMNAKSIADEIQRAQRRQ